MEASAPRIVGYETSRENLVKRCSQEGTAHGAAGSLGSNFLDSGDPNTVCILSSLNLFSNCKIEVCA